MALIKGTNSYVTVTEADSYLGNRLDVAAWEAASDTQKQQALITATSVLDTLDWTGIAVSTSQKLAFPRTGSYFDPRLGTDVELSSAAATNRLNVATIELAYHLLNNDGLLDDTGGVVDLTLGNIRLQTIRPASRVPSSVNLQIKPMLNKAGARAWWRAN